MKKIITLSVIIALFSLSSFAQTIHNVEVGGTPDANTPDPYFSPQFLTIELGDIVKWDNIQGWHSIDGTTASFPNNPDSFTNGSEGSGWEYEFTFTIAGVYDYECPVGDHALTQFGTITVVETANSIEENQIAFDFSIYPNPVSEELNVSIEGNKCDYSILDNRGRIITSSSVEGNEFKIDVSDFDKGAYIINIKNESGTLSKQFIVK